MIIPFFTTKYQYKRHSKELNEALTKKAKDGIFILGNSVKNFEERLSEWTGAEYAIGVASGSDALILALDAFDLKKGSEVITSPFTFFSSVSCIVRNNLKPVFVDIDSDTFNIDPSKIESYLHHSTRNVSAILPIHLFSQTADMDKIISISKKYNLKVLEDSAESFGVRYNGVHAGLLGDAGILSFFPTKTLGAYGDAGAVITNNKDIADKIKIVRVHGANPKYYYGYIGYNSRMDAIQAEVLLAKMNFVDEEIKEREKVVELYNERLKDIDEVITPKVIDKVSPVWYVYNIRVKKRDELQNYLKEKGIGTIMYYPKSLHLQECLKYLGYKKGDFPVSEKTCNEVLALPLFPGITEEMVEYVCEGIKEFYKF